MVPDFFSDDGGLEYYSNIQKQIILEAELLFDPLNERTIIKNLENIHRCFLNELIPKNFNPSDPANDILGLQKNFEDLCSLLESNGVVNPKKRSVLEVYSKLTYLKKKNAQTQNPK